MNSTLRRAVGERTSDCCRDEDGVRNINLRWLDDSSCVIRDVSNLPKEVVVP